MFIHSQRQNENCDPINILWIWISKTSLTFDFYMLSGSNLQQTTKQQQNPWPKPQKNPGVSAEGEGLKVNWEAAMLFISASTLSVSFHS